MTLDTVEALANTVAGLAASWAGTRFVFGMTPETATHMMVFFFAVSFVRTRAFRALFRWLEGWMLRRLEG